MVLTTQQFKDLYGIELADAKIDDAISTANESFFNLVSKRTEFNVQHAIDNEIIQLRNWYPITKDLSSTLTNDDIEAFEYDTDYNTIDRNANIIDINFINIKNNNRLKLTYDQILPANSGSQLNLKFYTSRIDISSPEKIDQIRKWIALKAFNLLSKSIIITLNQNGISSWNLNGVSVEADNDGINNLVQQNELEMKEIYDNIMPLALERTHPRNRWLGGRFSNL